MKFAIIIALLSVVLLFLCSGAYAGGPVHGARAAGMGTAFIGLADDPSALLHNPAGITQLSDTRLYTGVTALSIQSEYVTATQSERTQDQIFLPPHLYLTSDFGTERFVFGLALDALFGIGGREWDGDGATRYLATESTTATLEINPTIAWKATPSLSLAFGIDYLYAETQAERRVDQSLMLAADGRARIESDGDGWGYNLGVLIKVDEAWQLGMAYRSEIDVDFKGEMHLSGIALPLQPLFGDENYRTGVSNRSEFPEIYSFGVSFRPDDRWVLAADFELVRWSSFKQSRLQVAQPVPAAGIVDTTTAQNWEDSSQIKIGAEYKVNHSWKVRAGYAYIEGVVPESTLGPENPDSDQHNFSVGAGWTGKRITVDAFYNLGFFDDLTVENNLLSGAYDTDIHYFGVSCGYRF